MFAAEMGNRLKRLPGAGRGFGMHDGHGFYRAGSAQRLFNGLWLYDLSPRGFHANRFTATAFDYGGPSHAKHAVDPDDHRIARLNNIHDRSLHAG